MQQVQYECRLCKTVTKQLIRVVTDRLPPNVHVLQCTVCSAMGVAMVEAALYVDEEKCPCYYGGSCPTDYVHA